MAFGICIHADTQFHYSDSRFQLDFVVHVSIESKLVEASEKTPLIFLGKMLHCIGARIALLKRIFLAFAFGMNLRSCRQLLFSIVLCDLK